MSYDINSQQVDIENLFKQNELDLCSIKELYRKLKEIEKKITQIKYIDTNLADKLKKDYEKLKKVILDENIQVQLSNDIKEIDTSINNINNDINVINKQMNNIVRIYDGDGSNLQVFIDNLANNGGGTIKFVGKDYNITDNLTFYIDLISFEGDKNTKLIFNHDKGYGVHLTTYNNVNEINQTLLHYKNTKNYIKGIEFRTNNDNLILIKSTSTIERISSYWTIENCNFIGGDKGIYFHSRSWCNSIKNCYFRGSNYAIYMDSDGEDYGERINVNFSTFDNLKECAIYNANSSGEIWIGNCSIDYCIKHYAYAENGSIFINDSFIEGRCDGNYLDDYWFVVNKGLLKITNIRLIIMSDKTKEIFKVANLPYVFSYQSGIVIDTLYLYSSSNLPKFLVCGNGRAIINNFLTTEDSTRIMLSEYMNKLSKDKEQITINSKSNTLIEIPCRFNDSLFYVETSNPITVIKRYKDKDKNIIKEYDILKNSLTNNDFSYSGYIPQKITYSESGLFNDKSLVFSGENIDWCECSKSINVKQNGLYAIISNIKVENYTSGWCGSITNANEDEILKRKIINSNTDWSITYEIIKPKSNKSIKAIALACTGSFDCTVSNVMILDLSNTNLDWIVSIENTINEIHGNTKTLTNKEILTNRYYIPPQGTNYVEYEIINNNDNTIDIKCVIN